MSRDDKINKISSFLEILLLHVIKQHTEKRTTRSWEVSIDNALTQINRTNRRHKVGGTYLSQDELKMAIEEAYANAMRLASLEAFEGRYDAVELAKMVNKAQIKGEVLQLILKTR